MALPPDFPDSPHDILDPEIRWFPADEALRESGCWARRVPAALPNLLDVLPCQEPVSARIIIRWPWHRT